MIKNIILSGVGGQGILSIATVIGKAATIAGINLKQAEVHGMSQRGGDVQSNLRLSTEEIYSDLIREGQADIIIAMEPMEALRYVNFLSSNGWVITSCEPFINIPNYPNPQLLFSDLDKLPNVIQGQIEAIAKEKLMPKSANMILLGMAAEAIGILSIENIREAIRAVFCTKGEKVVEDNLRAFETGLELAKGSI